MARLVSIVGITHNPFHYRLVSQPRSDWPPYTVKMVERGELLREKLRKAEPEALVVIGNDHFHQFFMDNMPAFAIGKMKVFDGIFYNEVREFGLPRCRIPGDTDLAEQILEGGFKRGVDFSFSNELKVDHSVVVPLMLARPELDLPIVPIMTNCVAPPIPTPQRFYQVGRILREVIEEIPGNRRVAVVVSGHLSLEVGGPLQFAPQAMDEEFDAHAVDWIKRGDAEGAIRECTFERLTTAGNVSHAFLNFILAMGVVNGLLPSFAEGLKREGSTQAFFSWEPAEGVARTTA
jgi:protocatechuate 4,5-dioxygenase beta chain